MTALAPAGGLQTSLVPVQGDAFAEGVRAAHAWADELGLHFGVRKLHRLVRGYLVRLDDEQTFGEWVLTYADPTGETAVDNVMRAQR